MFGIKYAFNFQTHTLNVLLHLAVNGWLVHIPLLCMWYIPAVCIIFSMNWSNVLNYVCVTTICMTCVYAVLFTCFC